MSARERQEQWSTDYELSIIWYYNKLPTEIKSSGVKNVIKPVQRHSIYKALLEAEDEQI